jgi:uncharacterized protein (TIGR00251 family)
VTSTVSTAFSDGREGTLIRVRVTPRSSREEVIHDHGEEIRVRLTSPPVKGQANQALVKLLARALGVLRKDVEIVAGSSSRNKTVRIRGLSAAEAEDRLHRAASG